jgi:hypothetical protein
LRADLGTNSTPGNRRNPQLLPGPPFAAYMTN